MIVQHELLLSKVNAVDVIFYCSVLFVQPGVQLISERDDQYIPAYRQAGSLASIAENPMLCVPSPKSLISLKNKLFLTQV